MRKGNDYTYIIIKNTFLSSIFITVVFFIFFQTYMLLIPDHGLSMKFVLILTGVVFIISLMCGLYFGYNAINNINKQFRMLLQFISMLRRGNFTERVRSNEMGILGEELNEIATILEEQVQTIQRIADEKAELHEQVHTAAVMEERQRLARELHDSVSQQLFALSMMASATMKLMESNPKHAKNQMEHIADIAAKAQGEMRALLLHLRPVDLSGESLSDGVLSLLKELKAKTNINFDASVDEIEGLSKSVEEHLFRIIQESLSNILRHADANSIKLELTERDHFVYLYIRDNGKGFNTEEEKKASYGLKNMQERCEEIGGIFTLRSQIGKGTYIEVRVPISRVD